MVCKHYEDISWDLWSGSKLSWKKMKDKNDVELVPGDRIEVDCYLGLIKATVYSYEEWSIKNFVERSLIKKCSFEENRVYYKLDEPNHDSYFWKCRYSQVTKLTLDQKTDNESDPSVTYCTCLNPNHVDNIALGKAFKFCRTCMNEAR